MADTVNNGIPFVPENTIDPAAGLNLSLNTIDALLQVLVQTVGANSPPGSPANGARYIVGTSPTGAWAGQANKLARYLGSAWQFFDACYALNAADGALYVRSGSTWAALSGGGGGSGTVTSVGISAPTGFDVAGSPVTTSGTLALSFTTGYSLPTTAAQGNWNTAFGWGNHASAGYEKELTAGTNITIDRTDPDNPIISAAGGGGGSGDVVGPASAANNGVALFNGTTGKLIKDGGVLGSAAFTASTAYATSAQGTLAGTALQPAAIGTTVQGYSANLVAWSGLATSAKQDTLVSAFNIKTINGASILGPGDLTVSASAAWGGITGALSAQTDLQTALDQAGITLLTAVSATGTAVDFNSLPAWPDEFSILFHGVSLNGSSQILVQLGTASTWATTGYNSHSVRAAGTGIASGASTSGAVFVNTGAADVLGGKLKFSRQSGNTYVFEGSLACTAYIVDTSGSVALSGTLTRLRVTTAGTDSYDAGTLSVSQEG